MNYLIKILWNIKYIERKREEGEERKKKEKELVEIYQSKLGNVKWTMVGN
jgi:hypothetical protein